MMSIGERIKTKRNELGITQVQIKELTGISSGNLSGIESGKSLPSSAAVISLAKVFGCSTDWILLGESPISETRSISNIEERLISGFRELPEEDQEELLDILDLKLRKVKRDAQKMVKSSNSEGEDLGDKVG